jgi:hypothetical protein
LSLGGLATTTYLSAKAGYKSGLEASCLYEDESIAKHTWTNYIPAAVSCVTTGVLIVGSNLNSKQIYKSLTAGYLMAAEALQGYRAKVQESVGVEQEKQIYNDYISRNVNLDEEAIRTCTGADTLFVDEFTGRPFWALKETVLQAVIDLNAKYADCGFASYNDFCKLLGIPELDSVTEDWGWDVEDGTAFYGYSSIEIDFELVVDEKTHKDQYYIVKYGHLPHPMWEDLPEGNFYNWLSELDNAYPKTYSRDARIEFDQLNERR